MINLIVAIADNLAIGRNNQLLWHISEDLKYFKSITTGKTVIMGRKTFESIGKPLPNRRNIIISRSMQGVEGIEIYPSIEKALSASQNEDVFIIGGGEIYRQTLPLADKLYLTLVHTTIEDADTFFPKINYNEWEEMERQSFKRGEKFEFSFEFIVYKRITW